MNWSGWSAVHGQLQRVGSNVPGSASELCRHATAALTCRPTSRASCRLRRERAPERTYLPRPRTCTMDGNLHGPGPGQHRQRGPQHLLWPAVLQRRPGHHQGVYHPRERRHQVPHGCLQRLQPHQRGQPGRQHRVRRATITGQERRRFAPVSSNSPSAFSSNFARGAATELEGSFGSPLFFGRAQIGGGLRFVAAPTCHLRRGVKLQEQDSLCSAYSLPHFSSHFSWLRCQAQAPQGASSAGAERSAAPLSSRPRRWPGKGRLDQAMAELDQLAAQNARAGRRGAAAGHHLLPAGAVSSRPSRHLPRPRRRTPNDHESIEMHGVSLFRMGRVPEAIPFLERARDGGGERECRSGLRAGALLCRRAALRRLAPCVCRAVRLRAGLAAGLPAGGADVSAPRTPRSRREWRPPRR